MRSRVCTFQFLPGIASTAFLRSESHGTHEHILLSLFLRLPQPGGPGSCIYFPQEQGSPVILPGIGSLTNSQLVLFITSWPGPPGKHCSVSEQLLLEGMTYCTVVCSAISKDSAENTIPQLLFMGHCLVMDIVQFLISWSLLRSLLSISVTIIWSTECFNSGGN
jgi:hypothetical protein